MPIVSVIIPIFNAKEYIVKTVESILSQTFQDHEIILIDDSSTDGTREEFKIFKDPRIKIFLLEKNSGASEARNKGILLSKGEYIAFLDADDIWVPDKLIKQLELFKNGKDIKLVYSDAILIDKVGKILKNKYFDYNHPKRGNVFQSLLIRNFIPTSSVILKKEIVKDVGIFDSKYIVSQDFDYFLRIAKNYLVDYIDEPLVKYRCSAGLSYHRRDTLLKEAIEITKKYSLKECMPLPRIYALKKVLMDYHKELGFFYLRSKRLGEAKENFLYAIAEFPFNPKLFYGLISSLVSQKETGNKVVSSKARIIPKPGICMVLGAYYPQISGGAIQCFNLIDGLKHNYDFYIISTFKMPLQPCDKRKVFTEESLDRAKIFRVNLSPREIIGEVLSLIAVFIIFFKVKDKVQVFHFHGYTRKSYLITILAKIFRKKIIVKTTSFGIDDPLSIKKRHFIISKLYSLMDAYVVTSPAQMESCNKAFLPEKRVFMIPNGVNLKRFKIPGAQEKMNLRKEMHIPEFSQVILSVSFFSRDKGLDVFADSLSLLPKGKLNNLFLIFVGSKDPKVSEVEALVIKRVYDIINALNLKERTIFIDSTFDIERYFKVSDIFVLPSKREGLPNALLEAMACGLCCAANRIKGITDYLIIPDENGYLFDTLSPDSIAGVLNRAIGCNDIQKRLGHKARMRVEDEFDMDKIKERYAKLYAGLLKWQKR